jgi:hypothetical protein
MPHNKVCSREAPLRSRSRVALAIAAILGIGASASAAADQMVTVTYNGAFYAGGYVNLTTLSKTYGTPAVTGGGAAGADNISVTNGASTVSPLEAYCVDVSHYISGGPNGNYYIQSDGGAAYFNSLYGTTNGAATINRLDLLASNTIGQGQVYDSNTSAALQLAIWDIVFSNDGTGFNAWLSGGTGPTSGFAAATGIAAIDNLATTFLSETSHPIDMALTTYLNSPTDNPANPDGSQTLVTFAPVPLPATAWLLLSGLAGIALQLRRRGLVPV